MEKEKIIELDTGVKAEMTWKVVEQDVVSFDIETYRWGEKPLIGEQILQDIADNYVKPDIIAKHQHTAIEKQALSPLTGKIILTGFYAGEDKYVQYFAEGNEKATITNTITELQSYLAQGYRLITKGGRRFDLPYLLTRAAILGVECEFAYKYKDLFSRYNTMYHTDLELIFEGGLQKLGYAMGMLESPTNKGNEIGRMYEGDQMGQIQEKNKEDLKLTYDIYQRIKWWNL